MSKHEFVFHMDGVSKTYPGGRKCFENIRLSFLPGAKIGVVGVNGSGKSTLMRIMAGLDGDFAGEAWSAKGVRVGYLPQEPELDRGLDVRGNVMLGVAAQQQMLNRFNELAMNYSDETAEEMASLQDDIDSQGLWDLESQDRSGHGRSALSSRQCARRNPVRRREAAGRPVPAAPGSAGNASA